MAVGADVGGSRIKLVRLEGETVTERHQVALVDDWTTQLGAELAAFVREGEAVGVGVGGLVDHERGVLHWAPHLSGRDVPLGRNLAGRLARPVAVDNDANCAARAEARSLEQDPVLVVMLGTGIGAGLWTKGDIYRGQAFAGEVGHMLVDPDGRACKCGRRGCWETRISGWRLEELLVTDSALDDAGVWLARGLLNLTSVLDPQVIVLGGGVISVHGRRILAAARLELTRLADAARPAPHIVLGIHGIWAGAVGAALLAAGSPGGRYD